jgi:hypothetical protein
LIHKNIFDEKAHKIYAIKLKNNKQISIIAYKYTEKESLEKEEKSRFVTNKLSLKIDQKESFYSLNYLITNIKSMNSHYY